MKTSVSLVACLFVAFAGCGSDRFAAQRGASIENLALDQNSSTLISGTYSRDGVALRFSVSASDLWLADSNAATLLSYHLNADGSTVMRILAMASVVGSTDAAGNDVESDSGDVDGAVAQLMARAEMPIVPYLSSALAANGASGLSNAMSLQLHGLAAQLALATDVDPTMTPSPSPSASPSTCPVDAGVPDLGAPPTGDMSVASDMHVASDMSLARDLAVAMSGGAKASSAAPAPARANDCVDISNDPGCNNCLGMCGRKCSCWKWVCGDCCWHRGCYWHDLHCRACDRRHPRECLLCGLFDFGRPLFAC